MVSETTFLFGFYVYKHITWSLFKVAIPGLVALSPLGIKWPWADSAPDKQKIKHAFHLFLDTHVSRKMGPLVSRDFLPDRNTAIRIDDWMSDLLRDMELYWISNDPDELEPYRWLHTAQWQVKAGPTGVKTAYSLPHLEAMWAREDTADPDLIWVNKPTDSIDDGVLFTLTKAP